MSGYSTRLNLEERLGVEVRPELVVTRVPIDRLRAQAR